MHTNKNQKARVVAAMADYMLQNGDHCTRDTLLLQFSQAEIDSFSADAREVANRSLTGKAA